jgi:hypothetical protein
MADAASRHQVPAGRPTSNYSWTTGARTEGWVSNYPWKKQKERVPLAARRYDPSFERIGLLLGQRRWLLALSSRRSDIDATS